MVPRLLLISWLSKEAKLILQLQGAGESLECFDIISARCAAACDTDGWGDERRKPSNVPHTHRGKRREGACCRWMADVSAPSNNVFITGRLWMKSWRNILMKTNGIYQRSCPSLLTSFVSSYKCLRLQYTCWPHLKLIKRSKKQC